jgi:hypothetical protein
MHGCPPSWMDTKRGMHQEHSVHGCVWLKLLPQTSPQGMQTMHVLHSKPVNWCHLQRKGHILEASQNRYAKKAIETRGELSLLATLH